MSGERIDECVDLPVFPRCPDNRPGLDRIERRIGVFSEIREALFYRLNRDETLRGWTHRKPDDPGIALLEGAAIVGDILTFYQDLYANEAYLRTARWRESVSDLVRLLGYRLSPGVGGRATFAFEVRGDAQVKVPAGFAISAQVTGIEEGADFQTVEELVAQPWLSRFNLYRPVYVPQISSATTELRVASAEAEAADFKIEAGDRLLVGTLDAPGSLSGVEVVVIDSVRERHGEKLYKIKGRLQRTEPVSELSAYKIGRSFRHFGHNSPPTVVQIAGGTASQTSISYYRNLNDTTASSGSRIVQPSLGSRDFPLDAKVDDLSLGAPVICQITPPPAEPPAGGRGGGRVIAVQRLGGGPQNWIRTATAIRQGSYTWGAVTAPATVLRLDAEIAAGNDIRQAGRGRGTTDYVDIRDLQFHETLSPLLRLQAAPEALTQPAGNVLGFVGTEAEAESLAGRRLMLLSPGEDPSIVSVQSVQALDASLAARRLLRNVTIDARVNYAWFPLDKPVVTVHGNLADATQGKAEREADLGNGDNRQVFQTFKLPKAPLTYLVVPGETPPEAPELEIYVDDRLWKRMPSLFGAGPADEVYIVREDADGNSWVQFGDGKTGSRLPSGVRNVIARFRTGIGAFGALREGTSAQAEGRLDRLDKVQMPGIATGGAQPEAADSARAAAPGKVQSLDRLVSLHDFETETLALPGVSRAAAAWRLVDGVPAAVVTVLMDTGRDAEVGQVRGILARANRGRGPERFPVIVHGGRRAYFYVEASVSLLPSFREELVFADIRRALGVAGLAGSEADGTAYRRFGEREYATRIEGLIQAAEGVSWVRVTALMRLGQADDPAQLAPPATPVLHARLIPAAEEVLALHAAHLVLRPVAAPQGEDAL